MHADLFAVPEPFIPGQMFVLLWFAGVIVIVIVGLLNLRLNPALVRVRDRYEVTAKQPGLKWVRATDIDVTSSAGARFRTDKLVMAYSPAGLHLRMQRVWSFVIEMPTVCIPWKFVECESNKKFGFFQGAFVIRGFDDDFSVGIRVRSAFRDVGEFIEQSVAASSLER